MHDLLVLGIESTCDETACALVRNGQEILSNVVVSQGDLHAVYGGVFPELACRRHIDLFPTVIQRALTEAGATFADVDLIAVAKEPGLLGALLVGLNMAKGLSMGLDKPLIGVNHVEAHLYAAMMSQKELVFPALGVVISGGHTFIAKMHSISSYEIIGTTVDDAIGEAFDKVARMLGLPYPGGPSVEKAALVGDPWKYPFKGGVVKTNPWHFSFSGLKTSVLYALQGQDGLKKMDLPKEEMAHIAASFQRAAFSSIVEKAIKAVEAFSLKAIYFGGGVSGNLALRKKFAESGMSIPLFWPEHFLTADNAAMIAGLGYHKYKNKGRSPLEISPKTRMIYTQ